MMITEWHQVISFVPSNNQQRRFLLSTSTSIVDRTSASSLPMSGNFNNRMSRYGGTPEEDQPQPELSWDWNDEDLNNDDMFAQQQQQQPPMENSSEQDLPSQDIAGAQLTGDMKARAQASHSDAKEESSQGGARFRELMSRAKETADSVVQPQQQPIHEGAQMPNNPMDLSIEEQARLFRQLMMERQQQMNPYGYQQQSNPRAPHLSYQEQYQLQQKPYDPQQQQQQQGAPQDYRVYGTGDDGRKIGRSKDADAVSNTADAYFARLKLDSTSRNYARYAGDDATANSVFHNPAIFEIEAPTNPYLEEQRERARNLVETVPEEMLLFQEYGEEQQQAPQPLSYRQKLAQHREQKQQQQGGNDMNPGY
jgi:hypothetical protein